MASGRQEGSEKPVAQPRPPPLGHAISKRRPAAAPKSVSPPHQAKDEPLVVASSTPPPPTTTFRATSHERVLHRRTKGSAPVWATARSAPSGRHWRLATGPLHHRRRVTHQGADCPAKSPLCGQTRTMPCAPAVARQRPSGDHATAGHAKGSPRIDHAHHQPSLSAWRQSAMPPDMPTARAPRRSLGCHAKQSATPRPSSARKYCVAPPEKVSPMECTATAPRAESVASTSLWGCQAMTWAGPHATAVGPPIAGTRRRSTSRRRLITYKRAHTTQCSSSIQPARSRNSQSFSNHDPAFPTSQPSNKPAAPCSNGDEATTTGRTALSTAWRTGRKAGGAAQATPAAGGSGEKTQQWRVACTCAPPTAASAPPGSPSATKSPVLLS
mmetsp:Transcript_55135/g.118381  ORF Transcript_55135/g.118381 Transcript_55135/m.118381 type:complete len:384 (-) Transcript_55135:163-1314(-)